MRQYNRPVTHETNEERDHSRETIQTHHSYNKEFSESVRVEMTSAVTSCEDQVIFRTKLVLIWVWYPWLYWTYIFCLTWESSARWLQTYMFAHYKPVCLLSAILKASACKITASVYQSPLRNALIMWKPAKKRCGQGRIPVFFSFCLVSVCKAVSDSPFDKLIWTIH